MGGLKLSLKSAPAGRIDLAPLTSHVFGGLGGAEVARCEFADGNIGDYFSVTDTIADGIVVLEGITPDCDGVGANLASGTLIVEGDTGSHTAQHMTGGRLDIRGSAGAWLASGMKGGLVAVTGSAGDFTGGQVAGEKFGMAGGTVHISGNTGERAGERMRRGLIVVAGRTGTAAGARMAGGTIWAQGGFGSNAGTLMRRGTLIGPSVESMLATFGDCGHHDLNFLRVLSRHAATVLGPLAPPALPRIAQRYAGDFATIGKGEILLTR